MYFNSNFRCFLKHNFSATQSIASSSDTLSSNNYFTVFDFPSVDGVAAGRATALASLCRIVCAKSSKEELPDEQLAQFYLILHEALIEVYFQKFKNTNRF